MGQSITVESKPFDGFCVFTTDRGLTGQDSARFTSHAEAAAAAGFPATLAERLFSGDEAVDHVFVAGSDVIVRRNTDWDSVSVGAAAATISELFRFYE